MDCTMSGSFCASQKSSNGPPMGQPDRRVGGLGTRPDVCDITCRMVKTWCVPFVSVCSRNSGTYFSTGSSSASLPASTSVIAADTVTGLVMDAIQQSVLVLNGS